MRKCMICSIFGLALGILGLNAVAQGAADYDSLVHQGNSQLQTGNNDLALASANSAITAIAGRWEAYAVAGGALLNLKRYEEAADQFSHAIDRAPEAKRAGLRDLRKQCFLAESGASTSPPRAPSVGPTTQAEIVLWKTIEHSTNVTDFQAYLRQYPNGAFAPLANNSLDNLTRAESQQMNVEGLALSHQGNYGGAAERWKQACEDNNASACSSLAALYHKGQGVAHDDGMAAQLNEKGCKGGEPGACANLGYQYQMGLSIPQNFPTAASLYRKGCDGGNSTACYDLGQLYYDGKGVGQDLARAAQLYKESCDNDYADGCANLGLLYANGKGVAQSLPTALELFQKGCDGGTARACFNASMSYKLGLGVQTNPETAGELLRKACTLGYEKACPPVGVAP